MSDIDKIFSTLSKVRFSLNDEKRLQTEMKGVLVSLFGDRVIPEKHFDSKNIIDFFISGIGIEVKIKGRKKNIYKQCVRYCGFDELKSLILVTGLAIGFPETINNKDCYVLKLASAWL